MKAKYNKAYRAVYNLTDELLTELETVIGTKEYCGLVATSLPHVAELQ